MADCADAHPDPLDVHLTAHAWIAGLYVYPVKSMRALACETVRVTALGLEWDRQWMLVNPLGTFLSQRTHPQLARFVTEIAAGTLLIRAPGRRPLEVPLRAAGDAGGERLAVRVHRDPCVGVDQGEAAARWVSEALGEMLRLVRVPPLPARIADPAFVGRRPAPMGFADGFPLLVCNEASIADLNTHLPQPIPMERFRPNLVLAGLPPWAEDRIDTLTVGNVVLRLVKPCTRCTIPSIDQRSGLPGYDPTPALRALRFDKVLRGVTFGENAIIVSGEGCDLTRGAPCQVNFEA